jgi:hypothetical protein
VPGKLALTLRTDVADCENGHCFQPRATGCVGSAPALARYLAGVVVNDRPPLSPLFSAAPSYTITVFGMQIELHKKCTSVPLYLYLS